MKNILLVLALLTIGFAGCKKEEQNPVFNAEMMGKTYIEEYVADLAMGPRTVYRVLEFTSSSEVLFSVRWELDERSDNESKLKWEPTGNIGLNIIVHFEDNPSEGLVTGDILSFRNPTRVYTLLKNK